MTTTITPMRNTTTTTITATITEDVGRGGDV